MSDYGYIVVVRRVEDQTVQRIDARTFPEAEAIAAGFQTAHDRMGGIYDALRIVDAEAMLIERAYIDPSK